MAKFIKGRSGNPAGRMKGTANKVTKELRERISDFLEDNWDRIEADFKSLDPEKRIMLFERLLQYTLPKMQSIEMDADFHFKEMPESALDAIAYKLYNMKQDEK